MIVFAILHKWIDSNVNEKKNVNPENRLRVWVIECNIVCSTKILDFHFDFIYDS